MNSDIRTLFMSDEQWGELFSGKIHFAPGESVCCGLAAAPQASQPLGRLAIGTDMHRPDEPEAGTLCAMFQYSLHQYEMGWDDGRLLLAKDTCRLSHLGQLRSRYTVMLYFTVCTCVTC